MGKLEGKIGLVTGGTSGIGLATAKRFVDEGVQRWGFVNGCETITCSQMFTNLAHGVLLALAVRER